MHCVLILLDAWSAYILTSHFKHIILPFSKSLWNKNLQMSFVSPFNQYVSFRWYVTAQSRCTGKHPRRAHPRRPSRPVRRVAGWRCRLRGGDVYLIDERRRLVPRRGRALLWVGTATCVVRFCYLYPCRPSSSCRHFATCWRWRRHL